MKRRDYPHQLGDVRPGDRNYGDIVAVDQGIVDVLARRERRRVSKCAHRSNLVTEGEDHGAGPQDEANRVSS
jgi:hypothetical protein